GEVHESRPEAEGEEAARHLRTQDARAGPAGRCVHPPEPGPRGAAATTAGPGRGVALAGRVPQPMPAGSVRRRGRSDSQAVPAGPDPASEPERGAARPAARVVRRPDVARRAEAGY